MKKIKNVDKLKELLKRNEKILHSTYCLNRAVETHFKKPRFFRI